MIICVTGPESAGKTTLANELAARLGAPLVPETARDYLAPRTTRMSGGEINVSYGPEDVLEIAALQVAAERTALRTGHRVVIADTDLSVIRVWWEVRFGALHPWIQEQWEQRSPRLYLLMQPDLPWAADPLREAREGRDALFQRYRVLLADDRFDHVEIGGQGSARLEAALTVLKRCLLGSSAQPDSTAR